MGQCIRDVTASIVDGPRFSVFCIGVGVNDLMLSKETVVENYPAQLDHDLYDLANAVQTKSEKSLFMVGGPSSLWKYPSRWDDFITRARQVLVSAGVCVVPDEAIRETVAKMSISSDKLHFSNHEVEKDHFARAWVLWLSTYANVNGSEFVFVNEGQRATQRSQLSCIRVRSRSRPKEAACSPGGNADSSGTVCYYNWKSKFCRNMAICGIYMKTA